MCAPGKHSLDTATYDPVLKRWTFKRGQPPPVVPKFPKQEAAINAALTILLITLSLFLAVIFSIFMKVHQWL